MNTASSIDRNSQSESSTTCQRECPNKDAHVAFGRSVYSIIPSLLLFGAISLLAVFLSRQFPWTLLIFDISVLGRTFTFTMPLLALLSAISLARPIALLYNDHHEIQCHHVVSIFGILSLNKKIVRLPYETLQGVHIRQNLWERFFDIGSILVGTAMTDMPEIVMPGIYRPQYYADLISNTIDKVYTE